VRLIGNIKGRNNWFYKLARVAESGADPNMHFEKITCVDAVAAGVLDIEEIKAAKRIYPENVFRELYLAEPSDDQGNPFGYKYIERCIFKDEDNKPTNRLAEGPPIAFGWDVAKSMNWTVGIGLNRKGQVCEFHRWKDNWDGTINRIISVTRSVAAYVDSTGGGDPIEETLRRRGGNNFRGMKFSRQSKQDLMVLLATGIQQEKIGFPDGPIVKELLAFEYEVSPSGNVLYSAPKGVHDDTVDALAMAYKMLREQQFTTMDVAPLEINRESPWAIR
jgi:phage FluMu gp28-like protein